LIPKNKKTAPKKCNKAAKFSKDSKIFCLKHATSNTDYIIPTKENGQPALKKKNIDDLIQICVSNNISYGASTKKNVLGVLNTFFIEKSLVPIVEKKKKSANDTDLIMIGKNMKVLLNEVQCIDEITHVIIENQISPIANRMKTIQGMLAQYFIMKNSNTNIEFISSANKLKGLVNEITTETTQVENQNAKYRSHKKSGVWACSQIVEENDNFRTWKHVLETKKKDDLADCFLQGTWYLSKHGIVVTK
jgi:hypothetical protein